MAGIAGWLWPVRGPIGTDSGTGLLGIAGWVALLGLVFLCFWLVHKLKRRKLEGGRRAAAENRHKARRLYEEAFGAGNLSVIDEVAGEEFFDHLSQRRGPEGLKRSVASLRRTFPDLRVSVEEQSAEADKVTTRCTLRGTDRAGCSGTRRQAIAQPSQPRSPTASPAAYSSSTGEGRTWRVCCSNSACHPTAVRYLP